MKVFIVSVFIRNSVLRKFLSHIKYRKEVIFSIGEVDFQY